MRLGAASTRWAFCRNAHLSSFARQVNLGFKGHRSLAAVPPMARLCAELRPAQGFAEQRTKIPGVMFVDVGEAISDTDGSVQAVSAILEGLTAFGGGNVCLLTPSFDVCLATGRASRTCQHISSTCSWPTSM
mmetsp:Transcript_137837/g.274829  ORF Transcript_137837/g.274829 Transcript_137837/m.274829 type:complete len:132 (-) Transcript_137837:146-541(-)|eukprot:CAMPEP_0172722912 /NCGR_PEP_ID=MMETSP1074-20121228/82560_1 /TAXON_ID=2916 /ORGANISM="Ceratium fusus, Strain PA161109" /LENGTH=131 /DNA_ID=CAMNT_0013549025 /DNA_START=82 /DNA_END=477 /DNA_ORIENTATION=-